MQAQERVEWGYFVRVFSKSEFGMVLSRKKRGVGGENEREEKRRGEALGLDLHLPEKGEMEWELKTQS